MTLVDIKNCIFSHLMTESTFSLADDLAAIKIPKEDLTEAVAQYKIALFKTALSDLVKGGILVEVEGVPGLYVLTQPLNTYTQQVTLSAMTCEMVSDLVNVFTDLIGEEDEEAYVCNKLNVTGEDVARICQFCHVLLDQNSSQSAPKP